jgi:hypothetical protein
MGLQVPHCVGQQLRFQNENQRNTDGHRKEVKRKRQKGKGKKEQLAINNYQ